MGLALGTNLKFYTCVAKGSKLKVRKFWGIIPAFVEFTGEKLVGRTSLPPPLPPILNRVKKQSDYLNISKVVKYNRQIMNQLKCEHFLDFIFTSGILMDVSLWLTVNANTFTTCCTDCTARFKHAIGSYIEMCSSCEFQLLSKSSLF